MATKNFYVHDGLKVKGNSLLNGSTFSDSASAKLHVKTAANGASANLSNVNGLIIENSGSSNSNYALKLATGAGNILNVSNAGRVGIGTTIADAALHVEDDLGIKLSSSNGGTNNIFAPGSTGLEIQVGNGDVAIGVKNSNRYVGIGTTNPNEELTVVGDISASGNIYGNIADLEFTDLTVTGDLSVAGDSTFAALTASTICNTGDITVTGDVEADEFVGALRGAVSFTAKAGEALTKGDVVYISGLNGNTTTVSKADANDPNKMPAFGLAETSASANSIVTIYTFGTLSNLNTNGWPTGAELFVGTTAGQMVTAAPTGECAQIQKVGYVTRGLSMAAGSIKVQGPGRSNATPNLNEGRLFVGNSSNQAVADGTIHVDIANSRVGIGTTSPGAKLSIKGDTEFLDEDTGVRIGLLYDNGTEGILDLRDNNVTKVNLRTAGDSYFTGGNVGIGTTDPGHALEVLGASGTFGAIANRQSANDECSGIATVNYNAGNSSLRLWVDSSGNRYLNAGTTKVISFTTTAVDVKQPTTFSNGRATFCGTTGADGVVLAGGENNNYSSRLFFDNGTAGEAVTILNACAGMEFRTGGTPGSSSGTIRMCLDSAGCVGIGITTPNEKLTVSGNVSASGVVYADTFCANSGSCATIDFNDNLDVDGYITATQDISSQGCFYTSSGSNVALLANNYLRSCASGTFYFDHATVGQSFQFRTSSSSALDTTAMTITSAGYVGLGVIPTNQRLTLNGNFLLYNNKEIRQLDTGGLQRTIIKLDSSNDLNIGGSYSGALKFIGGGSYSEVMRIHDDGNVGIGTTCPSNKLQVVGGDTSVNLAVTGAGEFTSNDFGTTFKTTNTGQKRSQIFFKDSADVITARVGNDIEGCNNAKLQFIAGSGSTPHMSILSGGNVGIGITAPEAPLHILGGFDSNNPKSLVISGREHASAVYSGVQFERAGGGTFFGLGNDSRTDRDEIVIGGGFGSVTNASSIKMYTGGLGCTIGTTRMVITSSGSVGFGTNAPNQSFTVATGRANFDEQNNYYGVWIDGDTSAESFIGVGSWYSVGGRVSDEGGNHLSLRTHNTSHNLCLQCTGGATVIGGAATICGTATFHGSLDLQDNDKLLLGSGNDLEIYHNGSDSYISDVGTGHLILATNSGFLVKSSTEKLIEGYPNGAVSLYYDDSKKLETTSAGVCITDDVQIAGNLIVHGTCSTLNTTVTATSAMCIHNAGTGPALQLNQTGSQPIVDLQDDGTSAFYIEDGGNVGIGTNNPAQKLHVCAAAAVCAQVQSNSNHAAVEIISPESTYSPYLRFKDNCGERYVAYSDTDHKLHFRPSGTSTQSEWVTFSQNGGLGVGTSTPAARLEVKNTASSGGTFKFSDGSSRTLMDLGGGILSWNAGTVFGAGSWAGTADHEFRTLGTSRDAVYIGGPTSGSNHALYVDGMCSYFGGKVGINVTVPTHKLHVIPDTSGGNSCNAAEDAVYFGGNELGGIGGYTGIRLGGYGSSGYGTYLRSVKTTAYGNYWNEALTFSVTRCGTTSTIDEVMRVTADCKVGIGTTAPNANLMVGAGTRNAGTAVQQQAGYFSGTKSAFAGSGNKGLWQNQLHIADDSALAAGIGGAITFGATQDNINGTYLASIEGSRDNACSGEYGASMIFRTRTNGSAVMGAHMVIASDGDVGIGTTDPGAKLDIHTGTNTNGILIREDTDDSITHNLYIDGDDDGVMLMYSNGQSGKVQLHTAGCTFFNGGNVGIGTGSACSKLHVYGSGEQNLIVGSSNGGRTLITLDGAGNGDGAGGDYAYLSHNADGAFDIKNLQNNSIRLATGSSGTTRMTITSAGDVGIGDSSPVVGLSLYGDGNKSRIKLANTSGHQVNIGLWDNSNYRIEGDANRPILITSYDTDGGVRIGASGSADMTVVGGKVGIGTTDPGTKLTVSNSSGNVLTLLGQSAANVFNVGATGVTQITGATGNSVLVVSNSGSGAYMDIGSGALFVEKGGDVGIGTNNPDAHVHVKKSSGTTNVLTEVGANSTVGYEIKKTGSTTQHWKIVDGQTVNGRLEFYDATDCATRMIIDGDGNVGIGTITPDGNLTVKPPTGTANLDVFQTGSNVNCFDSKIRFQQSNGWQLEAKSYNANSNSGYDFGINYNRNQYAGDFYIANNGTKNLCLDSSGNLRVPNAQVLAVGGALSAPSFSFTNDSDTGISRPTTNAVNIVTAATERVRVDGDGDVGIGVVPSTRLHVSNPAVGQSGSAVTSITTTQATNLGVKLSFTGGDNSTNNIIGGISLGNGGEEYAGLYAIDGGSSAATDLAFFVGDTNGINEAVHIDSGGTVQINSPASSGTRSLTVKLTDNTSGAAVFEQSSNEYLRINTTNGSEKIILGDNGTNPKINFNGEYDFPTADGSAGQVLSTDGNGTLSFSSAGSGTISGSGTDNYIPRFNGTTALENSAIYDNGSNRISLGTVCTSPWQALHVQSESSTWTGGFAYNMVINSSTCWNCGFGGGILFGGAYNSSNTITTLAGVWATRTNAGDGCYGGSVNIGGREHGTSTIDPVLTVTDAKVGIGTTNPNKTLEVKYVSSSTNVTCEGLHGGGAGQGLLIYNNNQSTDYVYANLDFRARNADGRIAYQYQAATNVGDFHFITDNTGAPQTMMTIKNDGKVGIGTTNPTQPLVVSKSNAGGVGGSIRIDNAGGSTGDKSQLIFSSAGDCYHRAMIQSTVESAPPYSGTLEFYTGITSGTFTEKMRVDHNGQVGIGTTDPGAQLDVRGSQGYLKFDTSGSDGTIKSDYNLKLYADDTGDNSSGYQNIQFYTAGANERMRINSSGQAGFGTSTFGSNNVLTITNAGNGAGYSAIALGTATTGHGNSEGYWIGMQENGCAYLWNYENQPILFGANNTERMRITAGGNVGIGTTSPERHLHVEDLGQIKLENNSTGNWAGIDLKTSGGTNDYTGYFGMLDSNGNFFIDIGSNGDDVIIRQNGETNIGLQGKVLVGLTTALNTASKIHVNSAIALGSSTYTYSQVVGGADLQLISNGNPANLGSNSNIIFKLGTSGGGGPNEAMRIVSTGNVGIGTTNPAELLHIQDSNTGRTGIAIDNTSTNGRNYILGSTGAVGSGANAGSFIIRDGDASSNRFVINSSGNVGIGVTNPGYKLDVNGDFRATSNITAGDCIFMSKASDPKIYAGTGVGLNIDGCSLYLNRFASANISMVQGGGSVGIGTDSPNSKTDIVTGSRTCAFSSSDGTTWHDLIVRNPDSTQNAAVGLAFELNGTYHTNAGTGIAAVKEVGNGDYGAGLAFVTRPQSAAAVERVRIMSTGAVGIGTTCPGASNTGKLYVGTPNTTGSSAIAQFGGFVRSDFIITHNSTQGIYPNTNYTGSVGIGTRAYKCAHICKIIAYGGVCPSGDGSQPLGGSSYRWSNVHAVCTTTGAVIESNLCTPGIDSCPQGSVVVWRDGKLQGTTQEYDYNVMGVTAPDTESPIVMGAEPILVTGDIQEGDPIVTSSKINHGMKGDRACDLHGKVIAQALENGSGESYMIQGMIRKF